MSIFKRNPEFLKLWFGTSTSTFGDALFTIWSVSIVYSSSKSPLLVSLVFLSGMLPDILFQPIAGAIVDRYNPKKILSISATAQTIPLIGVALLAYTDSKYLTASIIIFNVIESIFNTAYHNSVYVLTPATTQNEDIVSANSAIRSASEISNILGFALGGFLLAHLGSITAIGINVASFAIVALVGYFLKIPKKLENRENENSFQLNDLLLGFKYTIKIKRLRFFIIWAAVGNLALAPVMILLPSVVDRLHPGNEALLGLHYVSMSIGGLLGSLTLPLLKLPADKKFFVVSTSFLALFTAVIAFTSHTSLSLVCVCMISMTMVVSSIQVVSEFQKTVDIDILGKSISSFEFFGSLGLPFAIIASGFFSTVFSIESILLWAAVLLLAVATYAMVSDSLKTNSTGLEPSE
ncbi:MFS transporter [Pelagicoccus albus]|uniref:MFS transporter n=1 Tax=Pelagicoccus albus TaxID=415222 RepID=A0A7X1B5M0_9BACT|nr:MFS transporter [Pelagicoccus albus]MBC2606098.1 MFS transporter [Pelagicoccus albus]